MIEQAQVERLARVLGLLADAIAAKNNAPTMYSGEAATCVGQARALIADLSAGVTLASPPRAVSPLEAAADALSIRAEAFNRMLTDAECEAYARAVLTAALDALEGNGSGYVLLRHPTEGAWAMVEAHLAALRHTLTEEGT